MPINPRKNRGGRPKTREHKAGDRVPLSLRVTSTTKAALDQAAKVSGRSQSQEVEFRLERSFERQSLLYETLEMTYGRQLGGLLMLAAGAMQHAMTIHSIMSVSPEDRSHATRPSAEGQLAISYVFEDAVNALMYVIEKFRPHPIEKMPTAAAKRAASLGWTNVGEQAGAEVLLSLFHPGTEFEPDRYKDSWEMRVRSMVAGLPLRRLSEQPPTVTKKRGSKPPS